MYLNKLAFAVIVLVFSAGIAVCETIKIEHQYVRVSSTISKSGAVFMHIMNIGNEDDKLIAVITDIANMAELHAHIMEDGIAKMREVEGGFEIPAGGMTLLERGGMHIMLMGLTKSLAQGDTVTMILVFEKAGEIIIDVPVDNEYQGSMDMQHGDHDMNETTESSD
ncbi:MAG: copper chaperone PCu(A)C [Paracoccaceae bacterium]